jgi:hypothetical protein
MTTATIDSDFIAAVRSRDRITGLTHSFYRYPARFSPLFARAAISAFTQPGDLVMDPFMGGGTSLVEAKAAGRLAVGTDINSLSVFISRAKTTPLTERDLEEVSVWATLLSKHLNLRHDAPRDSKWIEDGYAPDFKALVENAPRLFDESLPDRKIVKTDE